MLELSVKEQKQINGGKQVYLVQAYDVFGNRVAKVHCTTTTYRDETVSYYKGRGFRVTVTLVNE